ncbi:MAG: biopolymer transporter ExbD [Candidatus Caldatribacteriota bacterium]|jgi:biopolymer transport protein ExbD|nr:biopolymer transporter ExbD [Atribacterota bacterium]MDD3032244.1 biopolymer transporter ExbD [Atribacterota bacterium]MDD3640336.1 biopolymer transporter ExbD [Atribacterota bacterium]MDD4288155.1 biopolymer transporter ExbD [Atribacterota bacterium]MDD4764588.1 biopolymer transporter ExbD [Atribacterota bacterium]
MKFYHISKKTIGFDITPLIDVVFLLLIFFMLTTTFINVESGVKVDLPSGDFAEVSEKQNLVVSITENNVLYLNNRLIDPNNLSEYIREEIGNNVDTLVVLEADQNITHGKVVRVMDLIKKGGAEKIAIATKPIEEN